MKNKKYITAVIILSLYTMWHYMPQAYAEPDAVEAVIDLNCVQAGSAEEIETESCPETKKSGDRLISPISYNFSDIFAVDIKLKNPSRKKIISTEMWLSYDKNVLKGIRIDTFSNFDLVAPGEKEFDNDQGIVKIGLSSIRGGITDEEITAATVVFKVVSGSAKNTSIKFYDYQLSEIGHTNVNIMENNIPVNILAVPPVSFDIPLNRGVSNGQGSSGQYDSIGSQTGFVPMAKNYSNLARPTRLRGETFNSDIHLKWDKVSQNGVKGYNVYYGSVSGQYLHKKDAFLKNEIYLRNFQAGRPYFFAVTAYDNLNMESDYSDEIMIVAGKQGSSTSGMLNADIISYSRMRNTNDTGMPSEIILFLAAAVISFVYLLFSGKKLNIKKLNL